GAATVVVSLGPGGARLQRAGRGETRPAFAPDRIVDVTGAGDALLAGYAYGLASGEADPLGWGLAAASLTVETDASVAPHLSREAVLLRMTDRPPV
ncbi:MAG: carbohydrate kinase, partial [Actinobacteria bacterium]|nr:carbohydrate kinase [Actinomycetota bacterium]